MEVKVPYRVAGLFMAYAMCVGLKAQSEEDALRMSSLMPGGTARSNGLANAFGALGADPVGININPAGFGIYRTSEISMTPSFEVNDAQSDYYGTGADGTQGRFFFNNFALVLNTPSKSGSWRSGTFGVIYDRRQSQHWSQVAVGEQVPSTILQGFVDEANGTPSDSLFDAFPFTSGLAYDTYAIDPSADTVFNTYNSQIPFGSNTRQVHTIESSGASSSTSFFYAGNYLDRLYVGMSIGIAGQRYKRTTTHSETSLDESLDLKEVTYKEDLTTTGNGIDVKLGVIGRVTERFRVGASFHSPQWLRLSDAYVTDMRTSFRTPDVNGQSGYSATSPDGTFSYRLNTPWRAVISAAYIAGEKGLVSVDYEYADYRQMRFKPNDNLVDDYDFSAENDVISTSYRAVHSLRVGTEWRAGNWYYRVGWGVVPNAYVKDDARHGLALKTYAGGIGYRTDHVGVELGLNYAQSGANYFQYSPALVDATHEDRRSYRAMLTLSYRP
ncbi:MAG: hypothetical protein ABI432_14375 [Flavobacteriales bacterium]